MEPTQIGRYEILAEMGRGGMGVVYRARDPELGREVAIKVILVADSTPRPDLEELEARFRREARAAAAISHPGVITIHDFGRDGARLFLVMELIAGESLEQRLAGGRYPGPPEALELAATVAEALGAAHHQGVVHRDVKPANILLARDGRVVVTDFGIARGFGERTTALTRTGVLIGSPCYMAPEMMQSRPIDGRADLFSLGALLFELLTHRKAFPAQELTPLLYQVVHEDPLDDPRVRSELDWAAVDLLRRCLAKDPRERFPTASAFALQARRLAREPRSPDSPAAGAQPPDPGPRAPEKETVRLRPESDQPDWPLKARRAALAGVLLPTALALSQPLVLIPIAVLGLPHLWSWWMLKRSPTKSALATALAAGGFVFTGFLFVILATLSAGPELGLLALLAALALPHLLLCRYSVRAYRALPKERGDWAILGGEIVRVGFFLGLPLVLAALFMPGALVNAGRLKQKRTVADMRNLGVSWVSLIASQGGDPSSQSIGSEGTFDVSALSLVPGEALVHLPMETAPQRDGWNHPFELRADTTDLRTATRLSIRSPGRDGRFDTDHYVAGSFSAFDFDQDIVWVDGVFVRWPE